MENAKQRTWTRSSVRTVAVMLALLVVAVGVVKLLYGGGEPYQDVTTAPLVSDVNSVASLDMPPGCITVTPKGRVFFDTHPFSAPGRFGKAHVFELVDGKAVPWPSEEAQSAFVAPFGLTADDHGRLWLIEPGALEGRPTRLLGFDIDAGELIHEHVFEDGKAQFAQDLRVSQNGENIVLADTGAFRFTPGSLVVYDVKTQTVDRVFEHESLNPMDLYIQRYDGRPHRVGWGLLTFQVGVDGIAFSPDDEWLYFATMNHDTLYRLPTARLFDPTVSNRELGQEFLEDVATKPLSDGIETTASGAILLTDVEHGGIVRVEPNEARPQTLTESGDVIWADSVTVTPENKVLFTDSAIPAYIQPAMTPPPRQTLRAHAPYHIYEFELDPHEKN